MDMHQTHPAIAKRLRRAHGHLQHIIEMLAEGRSCLELAQQLQAVEKAIDNAKKALIHDHVDHCLVDSLGKKPSAQSARLIDEFRNLSKYL
jgi:DNA-binding FrmR family transcriptional regulator